MILFIHRLTKIINKGRTFDKTEVSVEVINLEITPTGYKRVINLEILDSILDQVYDLHHNPIPFSSTKKLSSINLRKWNLPLDRFESSETDFGRFGSHTVQSYRPRSLFSSLT